MRAATRASALARLQTDLVAAALGEPVEPVVVQTLGDQRTDVAIWEMGGQGVFVKEVQQAVLDGRADFAVHSAKDLPAQSPDGLVIAAIPKREDPRDALVGSTLEGLPTGGRVGTGSVRRRAQLAWARPDLTFGGLRGNIDTRLAKAADFDAIVVAAAALHRLGHTQVIDEVLDPEVLLPQVGQGALAVECRTDDETVRAALARIDHEPSRRAVEAERAYLREIGEGCQLPVGALATIDADGRITVTGMIATLDGVTLLRHADAGDDGVAVGRAVARHLLDEGGAAALLTELDAS
ncbi:MAG: hydroxymethylbilane synthase [Acidimicrobiia bacterium]|nr:hydroxymethylbilane synthase [Acidimicrobiia bacterium]MBV8986570.1 hydroxymethylbilane synthase [Acidimicrobiia bacterium]